MTLRHGWGGQFIVPVANSAYEVIQAVYENAIAPVGGMIANVAEEMRPVVVSASASIAYAAGTVFTFAQKETLAIIAAIQTLVDGMIGTRA